MPFHFRISNSSGVPFYKQIINQIIFAVVHKMLLPGEQLPTVRQLAVDLEINLNTVMKAYKELEIRGIVSTQQGTGTFISGNLDTGREEEIRTQLKMSCERFIQETASRGIPLEEAITALRVMGKEYMKTVKGE